jgi:hypothetical protein
MCMTLPSEPFWYWALLLAVVVARLAWCAQYLVLAVRNPAAPTLRGLASIQAALKQTTTQLSLRKEAPESKRKLGPQRHKSLLEATRRQVDTILVLGSLALAAWTQFAAADDGTLAASLPDTTRSLLFVGVIALIAGSVLFRAEGSHFTYVGRETAYAAGYAAIVFSLASAIQTVLGGPAWIGMALALLVAIRDWVEVVVRMGMDRGLLARVEQPPTSDSAAKA